MTALLQLKVSVEEFERGECRRVRRSTSHRDFIRDIGEADKKGIQPVKPGVVRRYPATSEFGRGARPIFAGLLSVIAAAATMRAIMPSTSSRSHWPSDNFNNRSLSRMV